MIKGLHHISLKCSKGEQYRKVVHFYSDILKLKIKGTWGEDRENPDGIMFDTGNGIIEVFSNKEDEPEYGIIRHFALETDNVDEVAEKVKAAGYEVFVEPKDISIPMENKLNARIAFCFGPLSEQIEFFQIC